jgi:hypothetical protein
MPLTALAATALAAPSACRRRLIFETKPLLPILGLDPQQNRRRRAMKGFVTILALVLAVGFTAPTPKSQSACEKAGMKWDSTASAPKVKCNSAFA